MLSEGELSTPSPWCPHPEMWSAEDAQSAEVEVSALVGAFVRALKPALVIETGTAHGFTAHAIGLALRDNGHGRLVTLEVDATLVDESRHRCEGLPVEVIHRPSLNYEPDEPVGFAWFDSLIELRITEFDHYRNWMEPGTIVGFHDVGPQFGQLGPNIARHPGLHSIFLRTPRGVCFGEVAG